ncbi:MAG: SOS response-associated peptidase family protein [Aerococcus sp.]|nr:SOS response-associated peptidase family protein [Aerococcus sp.]
MCGRYEFDKENSLLAHFYHRLPKTTSVQTGTVFPGKEVLVLGQNAHGQVKATGMRWGFDGYEPNQLLINARSETILTKPTFSTAFKTQRCVFPMTQFYEWTKDKQKYLFGANDPLFVAGCYQLKETPYGLKPQAILLTRTADQTVSQVHHRMPVIIEANKLRVWLQDTAFAAEYLKINHGPELLMSAVPDRQTRLF